MIIRSNPYKLHRFLYQHIFQIIWLLNILVWAYLIKDIPETRRAHWIWYLRFYYDGVPDYQTCCRLKLRQPQLLSILPLQLELYTTPAFKVYITKELLKKYSQAKYLVLFFKMFRLSCFLEVQTVVFSWRLFQRPTLLLYIL
jgi:hypothetical protein